MALRAPLIKNVKNNAAQTVTQFVWGPCGANWRACHGSIRDQNMDLAGKV